MSESKTMTETLKLDQKNFRRRAKIGFGLFIIFFVFYIGCAVIQTPGFQAFASIPFLGMPLGFFLSMCIFPVSWIILIIFFLIWR